MSPKPMSPKPMNRRRKQILTRPTPPIIAEHRTNKNRQTGTRPLTATLLDGRATAQAIQEEITQKVTRIADATGQKPVLAAVLVGDDPASAVYVRNKERACKKVGIASQLHRLDAGISTAELTSLVKELNEDPAVSGILVQLPLPSHIDAQKVLDLIDPMKDVDAFHPVNVGMLSQGRPRFLPCTPHGVLQVLHRYDVSISGKLTAIIGRSDIVGKPLGMLMGAKSSHLGSGMCNSTVTVCHSRTPNLPSITAQADIVVAAIGVPKFVTADMVKEGAVVVDVGINRTDDGLCGDVDFEAVRKVASHITPVPGGVGPLTVTMLLENTLMAAKLQAKSRVAAT
jgi:methylenetetrahydrofolate dehydrogenase (NADP+)/methenyltetrahydrofolate cyclohydrolase